MASVDVIISKINNEIMLDASEKSALNNILNWAKENGCPYFELKKEKQPQNMDEDIEKDNFEGVHNNEKLLNNDFSSNISPLVKTRTSSKRGKVLFEGNCEEVRGKNLLFTYGSEISLEDAKKKLQDVFTQAVVKERGENIYVQNKKRLYVSSFGKFKIGGKTPTIRTFDYDMLKEKIPAVNYDEGAFNVGNFLIKPDQKYASMLADSLKTSLENTKVLYHSEYVLSCTFFAFINLFGTNSGWRDGLCIYSIDNKMEDYSLEDKITVIRCDLVVFYLNYMYIIEFKYLYDRKRNMATVGLECIDDKKYVYMAYKNIKPKYPALMSKVTAIYSVGIGYTSDKGAISCQVEYKEEPIPKIDEEEFKKNQKNYEDIKEQRILVQRQKKKEAKRNKNNK